MIDFVAKSLAGALKALVRCYQLFLGPFMLTSCRFHPSCSHYALEALDRHGPIAGCALIAKRLLRCHPWGGQGVDPVPERRAKRA